MSETDLVRAVRAYVAAWNTTDDGERQRLLDGSFAAEGCYVDPSATVVGRDALVAHTRAFTQRWPGASIELTSGIDEHPGSAGHAGSACFTWRVVGRDGATLHEGIDVVSADADGLLCRVVGFFGAYRSPRPAP